MIQFLKTIFLLLLIIIITPLRGYSKEAYRHEIIVEYNYYAQISNLKGIAEYHAGKNGGAVNLAYFNMEFDVNLCLSAGIQWIDYETAEYREEKYSRKIVTVTKYPVTFGIGYTFPKPESLKPYIILSLGILIEGGGEGYFSYPKFEFLIVPRTGIIFKLIDKINLDLSYSKFLVLDTKILSRPNNNMELDIDSINIGFRIGF